MKRRMTWILALVILFLPGGCAWVEYQDTKIQSTALYLQVDPELKNFGYKRLMINCRYREPVNSYVEEHGFPELIYEYNKATKEGIRLFYLEENRVADFLEHGLNPNSATLINERPLDSYERAEIKELLSRQPL